MSAEFVAHMEDVLDLYAEPYDPQRPLVCFDETSTQLLADTRPPLGDQRGRTTNISGRAPATCFWPVSPGRLAACGGHPAAHHAGLRPPDALAVVDEAYPEAQVVRLVLDNLNTHRTASLYETFPAAEARRIAQRLEFHYTPKHGSWLNMAEIEFSNLSRCCLKQRVPDEPALRREVQSLVMERNVARATINWRFNTQDARTKLHRLYPFDS